MRSSELRSTPFLSPFQRRRYEERQPGESGPRPRRTLYFPRLSARGLIHSSGETMRGIGYIVTRPFINDPPAERYCIANGSFGSQFPQGRLSTLGTSRRGCNRQRLDPRNFPITILGGPVPAADLEEAGTEAPPPPPAGRTVASVPGGPALVTRVAGDAHDLCRNKGCKRRGARAEDKEERMAPTRYANTRAADTGWVVPLHLLTSLPLPPLPRPPSRYVVAAAWMSIRMRLISSIGGTAAAATSPPPPLRPLRRTDSNDQ